MKRPLILVVNDDSITAKGIRFLIRIMNDFGDVVVVAPDTPQSAKGHAITIDKTIRCEKVIIDNGPQLEYACSGTPADCVKLAINKILEKEPDLCVSGINHGSNSSINVIYSGTMGASIEASVEGIASIGFSMLDYTDDPDFSESEVYIRKITKQVLETKLTSKVCLNVNIPKSIIGKKIKGLRVCRQANAKWEEEFEERIDPKGKKYYWLTGKFVNYDKENDTDEWALSNHYISVVPVQFDLTNHTSLSEINKLLLNE